MCVQYPQRPEEGARFLATEVTDYNELEIESGSVGKAVNAHNH